MLLLHTMIYEERQTGEDDVFVKKRIGILSYRGDKGFVNASFLRRMIWEGAAMGAEVFVFSPQDVDQSSRKIRGFVPTANGWKCRRFDWPDLVIDHYRYYPVEKHRAYLPYRRGNCFRFANSRFANKFRVHQLLWQETELRRWLPETDVYSRARLADMLNRYATIYIKPTNGTGGRGILRVERQRGKFLLSGQSAQRGKRTVVLRTAKGVTGRIEAWMAREKNGEEKFLIQQGLNLALVPNRTVDARLLVQKDGTGTWRVTGMGMRIGRENSSTSNLHAGGEAAQAGRFLAHRFGPDQARDILRECRDMALRVVETLERHFGPMMEFGFDIGIDVDGRPWIIEINPKPGRDIFRKLGKQETYLLAVRRPLEYALYLLQNEEAETQMTL